MGKQSKKTRMALTPVQPVGLTIVTLLVMGFFILRAVNYTPKEAIVLDEHGLSSAQMSELQEVLTRFGQVQFFRADLQDIYQAAADISWVETVHVYRDWHRGVVVSAIPRKAIANYGSTHMLDANGVVFVPADKRELMNERLVTLHGEDARAGDIMRQMQRVNTWFTPLGLQVKDMILTPRRTWVVHFNNGLTVIVDYENTEQKLYGLAKILNDRFKDKISTMQSVDLRYKNGFSIAWKMGASK